MRLGVGLPSSLPDRDPSLITEWARRAEAASFSSLGVVDRVAYDAFEPMCTLASAAAVTSRIGLVTMIVIGPIRNAAVLGAQAASLDEISGGRLTLGLAVGARRDDYESSGAQHAARGERLSRQLVKLRAQWRGEWAGGATAGRKGGPELLVGGSSDLSFMRVAHHADGYVHGGGPPRTFARAATTVRVAWRDAGRPGEPRFWAQGYFALGDDARAAGLSYMRDYYAFTGPFADRIAEGLLTTPQDVVSFARGYAEAGCDELVLLPAVGSIDQLDRLADVIAGMS
jgi:alkanesulfonate monooxygenase SsuD/methylene tetrahydromethanopterin reductase-like flavin-dependent oxidoreductase (luciferase family)